MRASVSEQLLLRRRRRRWRRRSSRRFIDKRCQRYRNSLFGWHQSRIAVRNDETDIPTPLK